MGSPYTLDTAREILLGKRSAAVKALDRLLGAGILAAGPVGVATGQPWLLAAWGWVDQKNELILRLDELVGGGRGKLRKAAGRQRHEVLAATHTAVVVASFFAALREVAGPVYDELRLTDAEIARLAGLDRELRDVVGELLHAEIDPPWAGRGLQTHADGPIRLYYHRLAAKTFDFFSGLDRWARHFGDEVRRMEDLVKDRAVDRYRAEFLALAAEVPEFRIWALFGEHAAEQQALTRLEDLTATLVGSVKASAAAARKTVLDLNRAILTGPIVDLDETAAVTAVRVPTVERGYIAPHFRWAVMNRAAQPAKAEWWAKQARETDLAGFLAAHFASPRAAERPLVVLGHPGGGKSLFTKVCAARLSASDAFTTVRVPLRDVPDPAASVYRQVEDILRESTHGKVEWSTLCEASKNLVRVVLIDGLDELMQATGATESRYLRNVMDFQRTEAAMGGPVAAVVTSRTLVADLAAIPDGCTVVLLDEFTDDQIAVWAGRWAEANAAAVADGRVRAIDAATLRQYGDLARQPLLLLLLAIVAAERDLPPGDTSADLYRTLLDDFVRRELARPDQLADGLTDEERRDTEMWKLGLVAFGMLNRSRQHLHEQDLTADLRALPGPVATPMPRARDVARSLDPARRVVGRFFFVHAAEAEAGEGGRSYEFLHATFADYLIAQHSVELLRDAARARSQRTASQSWDDDLLFALLSHMLVVGLGTRTIEFFADLARGDDAVAGVLEHLAGAAHHRWGRGRHADYDPAGLTATQRLAAYTANLVAMRLAMADGPVDIARLCPAGAEVRDWWPGQVRLWDAMLSRQPQWGDFICFVHVGGEENPTASWRGSSGYYEEIVQIVALDEDQAMRLAAGHTLLQGPLVGAKVEQPGPAVTRDLVGLLVHRIADPEELAILTSMIDVAPAGLQRLILAAAAMHSADLDVETVRRVLSGYRGSDSLSSELIATLMARHPVPLHDTIISTVTPATELISRLSALLTSANDPPSLRVDDSALADTPEGRAVLTLPPDLVRRLIPELAASLMAREQDWVNPE